MGKSRDKTPSDPAMRPGKGGIIPPVEHRFKPGNNANPAGRPKNAGLSILEIVNELVDADVPEQELRRIARDKTAAPRRRAAAVRVLRTFEMPDLADIEPLLDGQMGLRELRTEGYDTGIIKKVKTKRRVLRKPDGEIEGEEVEREVELYDRSGEDFDRVCDRTNGKPNQHVDVKHDGTLRTNADGKTAADQAIAALEAAVGAAPGTGPAVS